MTPVNTQISDGIAILTIDNPPINATSHAVRAGLVAAIDKINDNPDIRVVILHCAGKTFIAGADIAEFGQPPRDPILPDVIIRLENCTKPVIAAIHGTALGGGLEIALGCSYRIATQDAKLGFPEVHLGLIPGAGGTVRLPRLINPKDAALMVANGKPVSAQTAQKSGLIDQIATGDLTTDAVTFARKIMDLPHPAPVLQRAPVTLLDIPEWEGIFQTVKRGARGQEAPILAAKSVRDGTELPVLDALARERAIFVRLRDSDQSKALRHIFFAERAVAKLPDLKDITPRPIAHIGVIGGGIMGAGIATASLLARYRVTMIERDQDALDKGLATIRNHLSGSLKRGILSPQTHDALLENLTGSTDYAALADANLVIEAVFEDMAVKHEVFGKLSAVCSPAAVLASNTSYLDINQIAQKCSHPERMIGLHFFSPAHIMKLLEIVRTRNAAPDVMATAFAFARRLGKIAVPTGVCDGFIGNRIMSAYRKQCEFMLEDGAMPHEIDAAMVDFGFPMGLFAMQDMAGLDISWATRKRQATTRDPTARYVAIGDILCEMGRFGRKNGAGWYHYPDAASKGETDPVVENIIIAESTRKGITRQSFDADTIMTRILAAMQDEGDRILAEGIAATPEAIDVVMVNGYGLPRWRGGPMFMRVSA
ncbi:MAG: 3-hydroxyacyl-CoA dehydrogenase NAD-binding domain-containing protein [Pseudomonadota bacterium]